MTDPASNTPDLGSSANWPSTDPTPDNEDEWEDSSSSINPDSPVHSPFRIESLTEEEQQERRDSAQRRKSSISDQISALPESSKASLERVRHHPPLESQHHSPPLRRRPHPKSKEPYLPSAPPPPDHTPTPPPTLEPRNPIQEPNWPDDAMAKPVPEARHLMSEIQDQIEKWICEGCEKPNQKWLGKCEWCGEVLPGALAGEERREERVKGKGILIPKKRKG